MSDGKNYLEELPKASPLTVVQPLELVNGKEYEHKDWGRVMFLCVFPHDGATLVIEYQRGHDDLALGTCEHSDLTPCNDCESYWPFLGRNCKERKRQAKEYNEAMRERTKERREVLAKLAEEATSYTVSVVYCDKMGDHVKLLGKVEVNYWPFSKRKTAHVKGQKRGVYDVTPEQACRLAQQIPDGE